MNSSSPPPSDSSSQPVPPKRDFEWLERRLKNKYPHASVDDLRAAIKMVSESDDPFSALDTQ